MDEYFTAYCYYHWRIIFQSFVSTVSLDQFLFHKSIDTDSSGGIIDAKDDDMDNALKQLQQML